MKHLIRCSDRRNVMQHNTLLTATVYASDGETKSWWHSWGDDTAIDYRATVVVSEKFPFRLHWTQTKCSVPVHGKSTTAIACVYMHARACVSFIIRNEFLFYVKISFHNRLYGKTLTFWKLWHWLSRTINRIKRRDAAKIHITSVS